MKLKKGIQIVFMILPFLVVGILWNYLPKQIPAHYGIHHQVDRWGSKYETLLVPFVTLLVGIFMLGMVNLVEKKDHSGNNKKLVDICSMLVLLMLNIMHLYFLYTAILQVTNLNQVSIDIYTVLCACLGVFLVIMGNLMPKTKLNGMIGFRCGWTMKNRITWRKCNFFAGVTSIMCGIVILIGCIFLRSMHMLGFLFFTIVCMLIVDLVYAHHIAKNF